MGGNNWGENGWRGSNDWGGGRNNNNNNKGRGKGGDGKKGQGKPEEERIRCNFCGYRDHNEESCKFRKGWKA